MNFRVAITPGHRFKREGAVSCISGISEFAYNFSLCTKIVNNINSWNHNGVRAQFFTRPDNYPGEEEWKNIQDLCREINPTRPNLSLEFHCNGAENMASSGREILLHPRTSPQNVAGAELILKSLEGVLKNRNRGIKYVQEKGNGWPFLNGNRAPSMIIEPGFFSNPKDAKTLEDSMEMYALAVSRTILTLQKIYQKSEVK